MSKVIKENLTVILAFSLPVIFIALVAVVTYLPTKLLTDNYNFLYATCDTGKNYYSDECKKYLQQRFSVINGQLTLNNISPIQDSDNDGVPDIRETHYPYKSERIFLHDTRTNESKEITLQEAQTYNVNGLLTSPDGVTITGSYDRGESFFLLFSSSSSYNYYLQKGNRRSKLNLMHTNDRYYYRDNLHVLGWITQ